MQEGSLAVHGNLRAVAAAATGASATAAAAAGHTQALLNKINTNVAIVYL